MLGVLVFFWVSIYQETQNQTKPNNQLDQKINQDNQVKKNQEEVTPLTEEEKEMIKKIRNVKAILKTVDIGQITMEAEGQELELKVPEQNVNFVKQTPQEDGSILNEEIGLFDLPLDKEVEVQYNANKNEVMLVMWKE
jgi:seryl-tRNA synthetase